MIGTHNNLMNIVYLCKQNAGTGLVQINLMGLWSHESLGIGVLNWTEGAT